MGPHSKSTNPPKNKGSHFQEEGRNTAAPALISSYTTVRQIHRWTLRRWMVTSCTDGGNCATCASVIRMRMPVAPVAIAITKTTARIACAAGECRSEEHTSELQSLRHLVCR